MQPPLPLDRAEEAVAAVQAAIDAGYRLGATPSAIMEGARRLGIPPQTMQSRIKLALREYGLAAVERDYRPDAPPIVETIAKPRVRVKMRTAVDDAPIYRVLAIGDAHDSPTLPDKDRFKWMAKHAAQMKPDYVVQIGDIADFDSLSRHDLPGSYMQKLRPSYNADMESLEQALRAFHTYGDGLALHLTLGNHERRVLRFEQGTAEIEGTLWQPLMDLFARYGWRTHEEGVFFFVGGVGFVHSPRTLLNKEYGGKHLTTIANDAVFSIVFGHKHRGQVFQAPKIGPTGGVTILNLGTSLPTGYVKEYARVATTSWSYGLYEITIQAGQITEYNFISMDQLERRYA